MNVAYRGHAARVLSTVEGKSDAVVSARWAVGVDDCFSEGGIT